MSILSNMVKRDPAIAWSVVEEKILSANATSVQFSNVNLERDGSYILLVNAINNYNGTLGVSLEVNGDTTSGNYYTQNLTANSSTVSSARTNDHTITQALALDDPICIFIHISKLTSNYAHTYCRSNSGSGSSIKIWVGAWVHSGDTTNVTSIEIVGNQANCFKAGSKFTLLKGGF